MTDTTPPASQDDKPSYARRIFAALIRGLGLDGIRAEEELQANSLARIVREELDQRWVAPIADFAKLQIARLEHLSEQFVERVHEGELKAIDRALKILDRLDRYHGFHRASPALEQYGDDERQKLMDKINAVAARLEDDPTAGAPQI